MGDPVAFEVAEAFAQVATDIAGPASVTEARDKIVTLARDTLGSAGTAIWHLRSGRAMELDSYTDAQFMALMKDIVGRTPDGPAWQAMQDRRTTVAEDFSTETRWPGYVKRLVEESPVRSAVVYPLGISGRDLGVLAVYSHSPRHFLPQTISLGAIFAAHASLALENASLTEANRNLELALASNRRIGMAIGILMGTAKLTETQAFDLLRVASQTGHRKLSAVAEDVILTGAVPALT